MNNLDGKPKIKETLIHIAKTLNDNHINWGLGGSLLLYLYGIDTTIADIDIVIDSSDIKKVEKLVKDYHHIEKEKSDIYLTKRFFSITLNQVDIDLMIGFTVSTLNGVYSFPTGEKLTDKSITIEGTTIYLSSLKDWLEAYIAIGRSDKIALINDSKLVK